LFVITSGYASSFWTKKELYFAVKLKKIILPIYYSSQPTEELLYPVPCEFVIESIQMINFSDPSRFEEKVEELLHESTKLIRSASNNSNSN